MHDAALRTDALVMTPEDIARVFDVPLNMVEGAGTYANREDEDREKREWFINQIALLPTDWILRGSEVE
jgi:hypothetical protein